MFIQSVHSKHSVFEYIVWLHYSVLNEVINKLSEGLYNPFNKILDKSNPNDSKPYTDLLNSAAKYDE